MGRFDLDIITEISVAKSVFDRAISYGSALDSFT